jgi:hypothetical protein
LEGVDRQSMLLEVGDTETFPVLMVPGQGPVALLVKVERWEVNVKQWGVEWTLL